MRKPSINLSWIVGIVLLCIAKLASASVEQGVYANMPSASPSGALVVFSANYTGKQGLWIASVDGKSMRQIPLAITPSGAIGEPAWSPNGQLIAFSAENALGAFDIWVVRPDGTGLKQLTTNALNNNQPAWSPDGTKIAFTADRGGSNDIWVMAADGSNPTRITKLVGQENHPSFSPDGTMIVFAEYMNNASTLMIVNADGTGLHALTTGTTTIDRAPNWSTYGIVFASSRGSDQWRIWKVQPDGTALTLVTGNVVAADPAWMPNGTIVYGDEISPPNGAISAIDVLDPATGKVTLVTGIQGYLTAIDIRPERKVNRIYINSRGKVKVAILSSATLDATTQVDQTTITFGHSGSQASLVACSKHFRDVNRDKLPDLICTFSIKKAAFTRTDKVGILRFTSTDGTPYEGRDSIVPLTDDDDDGDDKDSKDD